MVAIGNVFLTGAAVLVSGIIAQEPNWNTICGEYHPSGGECAFIVEADVSAGFPEPNDGPVWGFLFDDQCNTLNDHEMDKLGVGNGFGFDFTLASGQSFHAHTASAGAEGVSYIDVTIDGRVPAAVFDRGSQSFSSGGGIVTREFRQENFPCVA